MAEKAKQAEVEATEAQVVEEAPKVSAAQANPEKFLKDFNSVTIKMAKDQNLSLNPTKISGVCGRLMCCLTFENNVYDKKNARKEILRELIDVALVQAHHFQIELDEVIAKATDRRRKMDADRAKQDEGPSLKPASETEQTGLEEPETETKSEPTAEDIFSNFKG